MLEPPEIDNATLVACLRSEFDIDAHALTFLPIGADADSAVFKAETTSGKSLFVKLRRGPVFTPALDIPAVLANQPSSHVIAPMETRSGQFWTNFDSYTVSVFPYIQASTGFDVRFSPRQWSELGETLSALHCLDVPEGLRDQLPVEAFSSEWRDLLRHLLLDVDTRTFSDPDAGELVAMIGKHRHVIEHALKRADMLAETWRTSPVEHVLCHGDIHGGNVLIDTNGQLFVIDWDTLCLAPRERDLMYIGGGIGAGWNTDEEEPLFYAGYADVPVNTALVAYYRWERIVQDIGAYCRQILLTTDGGDDRRQALTYFASQFSPGSVVDMARKADQLAQG